MLASAVHAGQFNGKLGEVVAQTASNQRCPRNGKWTERPLNTEHRSRFQLPPLGGWCPTAPPPGKALKVVPPARIPANKVVVRLKVRRREAQAPSGKAVRALQLVLSMTSCFFHLHGQNRLGARLSAISLAALGAFGTASNALAQTAPSLKDVVVTATRTAQPLTDVLADVSVIDRDAIERSGARTLADMLVHLPGLEVARNGGPAATTSLFLRGANTGHAVLLIDGVRVGSQSTGGAAWQALTLESIDRIEVLRGPAAAIYGSDAVGGVVQVFTRSGEGAYSPSLSVGVGSHGTRSLNVGVSGAQGAWDYALGLGRETSTGFNVQPSANPDKDGYRRTSGSARVGLQVNRDHRLEATWLGSDGNARYDGYTPKVDDRAQQRLGSTGLSWQAKWSDIWRSRVAITQGRDRYETTPSAYLSDTQITTYLWHNEWQMGIHQLTAAIERIEDQLTNTYTTPEITQRSRNALALGYGAKLGAHTVQANVRHDKDSGFGDSTTGNLGYAFAVTSQWRVTASAGTTFHAPTLSQLYSDYGVPTLKPEEGNNRELGLKYADKGNAFSVVIYQNRVTNLIDYASKKGTCAAVSYAGCYLNTGKASFSGMTLAGATQWGAVGLNASLDLQNPKDQVTGKRLDRRAKQVLKVGANTQVAGWTLGSDVLVSGDRLDSYGVSPVLPGYGVFNLSANKPLTRSVSLLVRLDNVTNKDYQTASGFATGGRMAYVGLKWAGQ